MPDFDEVIPRTGTSSSRWGGRGDTIALTIGDADFRLPPPIEDALRARIDHGVVGYDTVPERLIALIVERLRVRHDFRVTPEAIVMLPGVVQGLNLACRAFTAQGGSVISETPVYYPFLHAPGNAGRRLLEVPAIRSMGRWSIDLERLELLASDPSATLLLLCNPHNPLGRVLTESELVDIAHICDAHGVVICADEIHCDIVFDGRKHRSIAAIDDAIARNTVTLMSPSKAFAISGMGGAFAVIPNPALREKFTAAGAGLIPGVSSFSQVAMLAAYGECSDWLSASIAYLQESRDLLFDRLSLLPGISLTRPEAAYFLWLDCRRTGLNDPYQDLVDAGVELSAGGKFGSDGFLRMNFASPRQTLITALERLEGKLSG